MSDPHYDETRHAWRIPRRPTAVKRSWQLADVPLPIVVAFTLVIALCAAKLIPKKAAAAVETVPTKVAPPPVSAAAATPMVVTKMPEPIAPPSATPSTAPSTESSAKARPMKRPARPATDHRRARPRR